MDNSEALHRAIKAAGSQAKLAAAVSRVTPITQQSISDWLRKRRSIPAEYVVAVERATGIPRAELRPDLYEEVLHEHS